MLLGIYGDILGSIYEGRQWKTKDCPIHQSIEDRKIYTEKLIESSHFERPHQTFTDDTVCSLAFFDAYQNKKDYTKTLVEYCKKHRNVGFGGGFNSWIDNPKPYGSFGNGCLMRIGFIPFTNLSLFDQQMLAYRVTKISHDHPEALHSVNSFVTICYFLKNIGNTERKKKSTLEEYLSSEQFGFNVEQMHEAKSFEIGSRQTLCQAVRIVLESEDVDDVIRNCFYVGGDSDTLACIALNIASCFMPVDWVWVRDKVNPYLTEDLQALL